MGVSTQCSIYNEYMTNEHDDSPREDKDRLISLAEAAELYGFSRYYLSNLAKRGRLEAQKVGGAWVTTPHNVEEYIRSREQRGAYRNDIQVDDDCN